VGAGDPLGACLLVASGALGLPPDWPAGPLGGHLLGALGAEGDGAVAHAGPLGFQA
jgi:hypothetical protein